MRFFKRGKVGNQNNIDCRLKEMKLSRKSVGSQKQKAHDVKQKQTQRRGGGD
jgi:hypothetical protein